MLLTSTAAGEYRCKSTWSASDLEVGRGCRLHGPLGKARRRGGEGSGELDRLLPQGGIEPPVEAGLAVQGGEEVDGGADGLRAAQKQDPFGVEGIVKEGHQFFLQLRGQVDQEVAAAQDIELGEGGVHDDVLHGEDRHLPDIFGEAVAVLFFDEEPSEPLGRHIRGDVGRKDPLAGLVDGFTVEVGGEDLEGEASPVLHPVEGLFEDDRQGVRLLPRGAAGHPGPEHLAGGTVREEREDDLFQVLPRRRIAEEARHADQELLEEELEFLGIRLEKPHILADPLDLVDAHAPLDPAVDGALLVQGKVVARLGPEEDDDLVEGALGFALQKEPRLRR